jgi:hypothetical protein
MSMAEQLSPPRSFAYWGKRGASGSLPWDSSSRVLIALGESGKERCELLVFSVLQGVGDILRYPLSVSQSLTLRPAISDTLQPVSLRQQTAPRLLCHSNKLSLNERSECHSAVAYLAYLHRHL